MGGASFDGQRERRRLRRAHLALGQLKSGQSTVLRAQREAEPLHCLGRILAPEQWLPRRIDAAERCGTQVEIRELRSRLLEKFAQCLDGRVAVHVALIGGHLGRHQTPQVHQLIFTKLGELPGRRWERLSSSGRCSGRCGSGAGADAGAGAAAAAAAAAVAAAAAAARCRCGAAAAATAAASAAATRFRCGAADPLPAPFANERGCAAGVRTASVAIEPAELLPAVLAQLFREAEDRLEVGLSQSGEREPLLAPLGDGRAHLQLRTRPFGHRGARARAIRHLLELGLALRVVALAAHGGAALGDRIIGQCELNERALAVAQPTGEQAGAFGREEITLEEEHLDGQVAHAHRARERLHAVVAQLLLLQLNRVQRCVE